MPKNNNFILVFNVNEQIRLNNLEWKEFKKEAAIKMIDNGDDGDATVFYLKEYVTNKGIKEFFGIEVTDEFIDDIVQLGGNTIGEIVKKIEHLHWELCQEQDFQNSQCPPYDGYEEYMLNQMGRN